MAIDLTPDQKVLGQENFARAAEGLTRRGFMKSMVAGAAVLPIAAAAYFGYKKLEGGNPVKTGLIGGGDEGGVLVGEHNPDFLQFIAVTDIRPTNMSRIFLGDPKVQLRKGFNKIYGKEAEKIRKHTDYMEMLKSNPEIEAVVIAVPLHLHAKVAIDVMRYGKERGKPIHVLCEKLMAWNVSQCKQMIDVAKDTRSILSIGHQRHYSMLYAHATEVIQAGLLGDIKHIRALWHRNNSWKYEPESTGLQRVKGTDPYYRDGWFPPVYQEDYDALQHTIEKYGYDNVEQLVRWRLYNATGGGLMAELGSHQLDACSIFLGKKHPLYVSGVGGKTFYRKDRNDRDCDDHVFVTFEFPGKNYPEDKHDIVVVTYSSISTNQFESYGECLMGTRGTMVVEKEQTLMLYPEMDPKKAGGNSRGTTVTVTDSGPGKPALEASSTWGGPGGGPAPGAAPAGTAGPVSRGYREEMEDFAYCVRLWDAKQGYEKDEKTDKYIQRLPRCHGEVAMADAIIALTSNLAMKKQERIPFEDKWFSAKPEDKDEVPDRDSKPKIPVT
jgi:predicted dehydrogenase